MIHKLCKACINTCKQDDHVIIVRCPKFQKRFSDEEFRDLVDKIDTMENEADMLSERVHKLIKSATEWEDEVNSDGEGENFEE